MVLADNHIQVRSGLLGGLADAGMYNISNAARVDQVQEAVSRALGPDLLIYDVGLGGGDICELISSVRDNELGLNFFIVTSD